MIGKEARGEVNKIFCLRAFKGRTIRKVMGGRGIFEQHQFCFFNVSLE